jgi:hypothetical protein
MRKLVLVCSILGLVSVARIYAQGTSAFTYQGRLDTTNGPANGLYDFRCQLYDAQQFGALVSTTVTNPAVSVVNGLFTLNLDFGPTVFNGQERWLLITMRTNNALNFTALTPRQHLTPTPYALYAGIAGNLVSGANQTFNGTVNFNPASGPPFSVGSANKVLNLNADLLDGLDSAAFVLKAGDTMTGNLTLANPASINFGSTVRQMLNLWGTPGTDYGIGVQAATLYQRSQSAFAWFRGGSHANAQFDPGTGGTRLMTLENTGRLTVEAAASTLVVNDVGILFGNGIALSADANGVLGVGLSVQADDASGSAIIASSANGYAGQFYGAVRLNFASPFNKPQLEVVDPADTGFARIRMRTGSRALWDIATGTTPGLLQTNSLRFFSEGNGDVMSLSTNGNLFVRVLTITGGADLAEPFQISNKEISKGSVVIIDEEHAGQLKLSERAYDTRVAGIVSGANGVNPGLMLSQQGVLEGNQNVALSGRVYVQADASTAPIKPGDLLTTASTPGHAMKVTDPARAQGAILGKAMTPLNDGRGLVLVLVSLQ